jgi:hypothetical protein
MVQSEGVGIRAQDNFFVRKKEKEKKETADIHTNYGPHIDLNQTLIPIERHTPSQFFPGPFSSFYLRQTEHAGHNHP